MTELRADVVVAGGGPAGLAAAITAARAGLSVVVVEPRGGVIDKACGEGLMPGGVRMLRELGVPSVRGVPFAGVTYGLADRPDLVATGSFRGEPGLGIRRIELHRALLERAEEASVRWRAGRVTEIEQRAEEVIAGGVRARWLIAADGLHSTIRRTLGVELPARGPRRFGVRRHFRVEPWSDRVEVTFAEGAEAYVTPVAEDLVGVAFLYEPPARFEGLLARFPRIAERVRHAAYASEPRGAGPFRQRVRRRVVGRVLLAGDAAGYVDPLTGEGVALGMASGVLAARAVMGDSALGYDAAWLSLTREYRLLTEALLGVARRAFLHRPLVLGARALPSLFDRALALLGDVSLPPFADGTTITTRSRALVVESAHATRLGLAAAADRERHPA